MAKSGTTATFKYNSEGLRVQKTVNGTVTNYTLHGKNIVHMTQGSNTLHFWYDASNRPAIVQFNGTKYAYIHNLQGDIVGILNTAGTEVVKYTYDAWGKVLSTTGSLASTLGTVQPFRYRGYVYDVETELYYLRSRYYNPSWQRFVNADSIINDNIFSLCHNNPILYGDYNGNFEFALPAPSNPIDWTFISEILMGIGIDVGTGIAGGIGFVIGFWPASTCSDEEDAYESLKHIIHGSEAYKSLLLALHNAKSKGDESEKKPRKATNEHHIVARLDPREAVSWPLLRKAGINRFSDSENIVEVPTKYHWFLHTTLYYGAVNQILKIADNLEYGDNATNIKNALGIIKAAISFIFN